jgi:hypothetical protein
VALVDNVSMCVQLAGGAVWSKKRHLWGVDPTERSIWAVKWGTSPARQCLNRGSFFYGFKHCCSGGERWVVRLAGGTGGAPALQGDVVAGNFFRKEQSRCSGERAVGGQVGGRDRGDAGPLGRRCGGRFFFVRNKVDAPRASSGWSGWREGLWGAGPLARRCSGQLFS